MQVVYTHCAGLDVHKKTVTACMITPNQKGGFNKEIRTFETHTNSLLNMLDWLLSLNCTHVAIGLYRRVLATSIQHLRKQFRGNVSQCSSREKLTRTEN